MVSQTLQSIKLNIATCWGNANMESFLVQVLGKGASEYTEVMTMLEMFLLQ